MTNAYVMDTYQFSTNFAYLGKNRNYKHIVIA